METKVIVITGASSGIGKATALQLTKEGHKVYGLARRQSEMQDLEALGGVAMELDVTEEEKIAATIQTIIQQEGKIDVLWNNAGYGLYGAVEDIPTAEARRQFEVNLFGLANVTKAVLPQMRKQGNGLIINTSSMGGKMYTPLGAWYHATKHALEGWSDCLRIELQPFGIKVVILEPGVIGTDFGEVLLKPLEKFSKQSPYESMAQQIGVSSQRLYSHPNGHSKPELIARTVSKIVRTKNPKTRYRVGKFAKPFVWMRLYLGDRIFDTLLSSQIKST